MLLFCCYFVVAVVAVAVVVVDAVVVAVVVVDAVVVVVVVVDAAVLKMNAQYSKCDARAAHTHELKKPS